MYRIFDKKVIDLIIPVEDYVKIHHNATIFEALMVIENSMNDSQRQYKPRYPLLVVDDNDRIIGKIGILCCLKAIKPSFCMDFDDIERIKRLEEFHSDFLISLLCRHLIEFCNVLNFNKADLDMRVINAMNSINESIDGDSSILNAIQQIISMNTLSILVTVKSQIVGIVHLFDLYNNISKLVDYPKIIN